MKKLVASLANHVRSFAINTQPTPNSLNPEKTNAENREEFGPDALVASKTLTHIAGLKISDAVFVRLLALFAMAMAMLVYGYEIANYSLSIDEEVNRWYFSENSRAWIGQGRWAMGMLVYLLPSGLSSMPFLPTFLFAMGLAISAVVFSRVITDSREEAVVFTGIFVTCPVLLHIGEFTTFSWGIAIGLITTAFASRSVSRGGTRNSLIAGACVGFSMAIYQALLILYCTIVSLICIKKEGTQRQVGTVDSFTEPCPSWAMG